MTNYLQTVLSSLSPSYKFSA